MENSEVHGTDTDDDLDPDHMADRALHDLRSELLGADPRVVITNHCYGLFELVAVYLSATPPLLNEAQLAIDALGGIVDALGERLHPAGAELAPGLASLRLAYVQLSSLLPAGDNGTSE